MPWRAASEILRGAVHHDVGEKTHRIGERHLGRLEPHDAARNAQQLRGRGQGSHGDRPPSLPRRTWGVSAGKLARFTALTAAASRARTSLGKEGRSSK